MKTKLGNTIIAVVLAATMVFAVGCSDDDEDSIMNPGGGKTAAVTNLAYGAGSGYATLDNGAQLRAVHASPDAPAVDVYVVGSAGSYTVELRAAGADPNSVAVYSVDVTIGDNATVTAVAAGLLGSSNDADKFRILPFVEAFDPAPAGKFMVRVVHASADAPTVSVDVGDDGTADYPSLAGFAATPANGIALDADANLQIAILAGGSRVTAFTTPEIAEGTELFVIASGLLAKLPSDSDGFQIFALAPTTDGAMTAIKQNPTVFALHGSPDAPAVDIYAGAAMLVENLAFGELSDAVQVPPGAYTLDFKANGSGVTAASATTPSLAAGERYLAIASGFLASGQPDFRLLPFGDSFADAGMDALVRVVHASPDAPAVDVGTVNGNIVTPVPDFTNLAFEQASIASGTELPPGNLPIGIAAAGTTTPVVTFTVPTTAGLKAYAVAAGSLGGSGESFRLVIVDATNYPWQAVEVFPN